MYCSNCGAQVPGQVKFCPECGSPVNTTHGSSATEQAVIDSKLKKIVLRSFPPDQKTAVMRLVCKITRVDLTQARSLIERPNLIIGDGLTTDQAREIAQEFKRVGASVDILESTGTVRGTTVQGPPASTQTTGQLCCPICGSTNCTPVVETSTSGSDFSAGKGCCGYIMLGPIGLLCGACGGGKQTNSKTYWMCSNCGNKFQK